MAWVPTVSLTPIIFARRARVADAARRRRMHSPRLAQVPSMMPPIGKSRWKTLLLVAERNGPEMLARIAVMKALNRHGAKETPEPRRKSAKVFRIAR